VPRMARSLGEDERRRAVPHLLIAGLSLCVLVGVLEAGKDRAAFDGLTLVLACAAVSAGAMVVKLDDVVANSVSASFIVVVLAAAFLGPVSASVAAVMGEVAAAWRKRTRPTTAGSNLLAVVVPALVTANIIRWLAPGNPTVRFGFFVAVFVAGAAGLLVNFVIVAAFSPMIHGHQTVTLGALKSIAPSLLLSLVLAVAGAGIYLKLGIVGIAFALTAVFALTYMLQLVERARARSEQYVSLSWGVLAGLMRSLDIRDQRAARHAAAVARFARDIAAAVGMSEADRELAHTAGLLHDIGHFALSDRVAERGRTLTEEDWAAIQRHPELGADMLRDLGMYGPVAEIVLTHHERIDGRGYPQGLTGDQIPELAKIISVAEVYDTLTASDTYRTRMSSFEALTELRRVAGSQVDERYVEILAGLLTGVGVEYRHADMADFDVELDMERRIREAGAGG
jgi:putative nucleotidyltransferase with HDIG domain